MTRRSWLILIVSNYLHTQVCKRMRRIISSSHTLELTRERERQNDFDWLLSDGDTIYFDRQVEMVSSTELNMSQTGDDFLLRFSLSLSLPMMTTSEGERERENLSALDQYMQSNQCQFTFVDWISSTVYRWILPGETTTTSWDTHWRVSLSLVYTWCHLP